MTTIGEQLTADVQTVIDASMTEVKSLITPVYNVVGYEADVTGAKDCTGSVQETVDAATEGSTVFFPPGIYSIGHIVIPRGIRLSGYGAVLVPNSVDAGFELAQTDIDGLVMEGFSVLGDGTGALAQSAFVRCFSGANVRNAVFRDLSFEKINFGLFINSDVAGEYTNAYVIGCRFKDMVGGESGSGLGVAIMGGDTVPTRLTVMGCVFDNCYRHGLYLSNGSDVTIIGNHFRRHRANMDNTGFHLGALQLSRCKRVIVEGNSFTDNHDVAVVMNTDDLNRPVEDVVIHGNRFSGNERYDVVVGIDTPDVNGQLRRIKVSGNLINRATNNLMPAVQILSGQDITFSGNDIHAIGMSGTYAAVNVYAYGASNPSDRIIISGNRIRVTTTSGTGRAIVLASSVCSGTQEVRILGNDLDATYRVYSVAALTNPNVIQDTRRVGAGTAAPTAGSWSASDVIYNTLPTASGKIGWVCVNGGTPGTWKAFGAIDA